MHRWQWILGLTLALGACIDDRGPQTDPGERDDAALPDRGLDAQTDPPPDLGGSDAQADCLAAPVCPPEHTAVDACPDDTACVTVAACGVEVLCAPSACQCPDGTIETELCAADSPECTVLACESPVYCVHPTHCQAEPTCLDGGLRIAPCAPDDALCTLHTECGITFGCVPAQCCGRPDECPPRTFLDPTCAADDPACMRIGDCGQPRWCRTRSTCPPHSRPVDQCALDDPMCWVLFDGQACLSELCPLEDPCPACAAPVDACPQGESCRRITRCGAQVLCQLPPPPPPGEGDACADSCPVGWRDVQACRPGRDCARTLGCCGQELWCERCATDDCAEPVEPGGCPPFMEPVERCAARAAGCAILPNGQYCATPNICPPGVTCVQDPPDGCEDRNEGEDPDGVPDPPCWPGSRYTDACSPNGRSCAQSSICGFANYCEACSPCDADCLE